jgi:RNA ligase
MNKELLQQMIDERLVSVRKHPEAELFIYNYTPRVQYDKLWNEITLQTRGLIMDAEMNVIAKPFGKFFNLEEHQPNEIPQLPFEVFDKLDGSLGILYWLNDKPFIATRGSFESEQSQHATELLYNKYIHTFEKFDRNKTYLFEIIYPQNRIVVDYGAMDDLILLTVIDNATGNESIEELGFPIVKRFDGINDLMHLKTLEEENKEGFVVRFKNGLRVKMKFAEYVRLHRIITGVSNVAIWEYLKEGKSFDELLQKVPDEFYDWLMQTANELEMNFKLIYDNAQKRYTELYNEDKKTFALKVLDEAKDISSILFNIYNGKKVEPVIWKMLRPEYAKPFKTDLDA